MRRALSHSPALLPAAAAVVAFGAALAVGMTTKSSPTPQPATSLAAPVSVQAPRASVAALQRAVPTPALKPRPAPAKPKTTSTPTTPVAPVQSTPSAPPPTTGVTHSPTTGVIHTPTTGVIHTPTTGVVHSPGGSGVVHGGN